jgi:hypothetical protein
MGGVVQSRLAPHAVQHRVPAQPRGMCACARAARRTRPAACSRAGLCDATQGRLLVLSGTKTDSVLQVHGLAVI